MGAGNIELQWYVLYTRPKFEKKICREIAYLKCEHYCPQRVVARQWSDRIKKVEEPLFSGYVFVKADARARYDMLKIPGVVKFVSNEGTHATISVSEINRIRLIETCPGHVQREDYYTPGDLVMVRNGVFEGMKGILVRLLGGESRFLIRLPILKQAISVEIDAADLVKCNEVTTGRGELIA
nr:UpxY family transcription antiterminator [uncultured Chitinophaga sp.]